jgi:hypothetical protein
LTANIVIALCSQFFPTLALLTSFIILNVLLTILIVSGYIGISMNKLHLDSVKVDEKSYKNLVSVEKKNAIRRGITFAIYMWLVRITLNWVFYGQNIITSLSNLYGYVWITSAGLVFGVATYLYNKSRIKQTF